MRGLALLVFKKKATVEDYFWQNNVSEKLNFQHYDFFWPLATIIKWIVFRKSICNFFTSLADFHDSQTFLKMSITGFFILRLTLPKPRALCGNHHRLLVVFDQLILTNHLNGLHSQLVIAITSILGSITPKKQRKMFFTKGCRGRNLIAL